MPHVCLAPQSDPSLHCDPTPEAAAAEAAKATRIRADKNNVGLSIVENEDSSVFTYFLGRNSRGTEKSQLRPSLLERPTATTELSQVGMRIFYRQSMALAAPPLPQPKVRRGERWSGIPSPLFSRGLEKVPQGTDFSFCFVLAEKLGRYCLGDEFGRGQCRARNESTSSLLYF